MCMTILKFECSCYHGVANTFTISNVIILYVVAMFIYVVKCILHYRFIVAMLHVRTFVFLYCSLRFSICE